MAQTILKPVDRQAGRNWESYYESFIAKSVADANESEADRKKRIKDLEKDFEAWKLYYFPQYCYAPSASFHKRAAKRELENPEWYETRAWARELAKDVVEMIVTLYQGLTGKKKNILFISNSNDKAGDLLEPYRINLTSNERIINDYGIQANPGSWAFGDFTTTQGVSFLAVGADQSPRGSREEEYRPDKVILSDVDTDEDVLNVDIINKRWKKFEKAVYPVRSVSKDFQVIFLGNVIAKDCCIVRSMEKADYVDIVNLINKDGISTWPEKNKPEHIERIRSKISTMAFEGEYMNNPLSEGTVFKDVQFGKVPLLGKFPFLVAYGDPAPSNSKNKAGSSKSLWLMGKLEGKTYVIKGFLDKPTNAEYVEWYYAIKDYAADKTVIYNYIENNSLQDPFYEQVFIPLFTAASKVHGTFIGIIPDDRKKPDKFSRIEGNLEPPNRLGNLVFNEAEKDNPHMVRLVEQFKLVAPGLKAHADGPDCIEGGEWILNAKYASLEPGSIRTFARSRNSKRI